MKKIRLWISAVLFVTTVGGVTFAAVSPQTAAADSRCSGQFLLIDPWYKGLQKSDTYPACRDLKSPSDLPGGLSAYIWLIVLNVVDILLRAAGYIAVGFILYGGFVMITNGSSPDGQARGRKTILNAVIGLIITVASIAIVNLVAGAIK